MAGGLMQLVAYGAQDVYLTGNPQITFFKVMYRRHTNFATESIEQYFGSQANFGRTGVCEVSRSGDLITQVIAKIGLPEVRYSGDFPNFGHVEFAWVKNVGHAAVEYVELDVGGTKVDRNLGDWFNTWKEVSSNVGHDASLDKMLGNVPELTSISTLDWDDPDNTLLKPAYTLHVPLQFYFCRNNGLALPLIALQYHPVRISIKFRPADQCYIASEAFKSAKHDFEFTDASLYINYVFLDTVERKRYAQYSHEYLIEQVQSTGEESIQNGTSGKYRINFNHPIKALYFVTKLGNYQGQKFMIYDCQDWELARKRLAKLILLSQYDLDEYGYFSDFDFNQNNSYTLKNRDEVKYDAINPADPNEEPKYMFNDSLTAGKFDGSLLIGRLAPTSHLLYVKNVGDLRDKVEGVIRICTDARGGEDSIYPEVEKVTRNDLTIMDLSIPVSKFESDNRCNFVKHFDVIVWQHDNFGLLIDGTINPITEIELKLNGAVRQNKRSSFWYDTVEPYLHHKRAPKDGVNVLSFALNPEEHQPSCTCNFSRIDTAELFVWFGHFSGNRYSDIFINRDNKVLIFGVNYNVMRLMSGMCGLAYSN